MSVREEIMIKITPIDYPGFDNVFKNIDYYKEKFIKDSVIVFRGANLSLEDQKLFHYKLGDFFKWHTPTNEENYYKETHSHNILIDIAKEDDIMLGWHVEHCYYDNPIVAGTWNMYHLQAPPGAGKTYFVDTSAVYNMLDNESKDFLKKCSLNAKNFGLEEAFPPYKTVVDHWITGVPVIRMPIEDHWSEYGPLDEEYINGDYKIHEVNILHEVNGEKPNKQDYKTFSDIAKKIGNIVKNNEDIRMFHQWEQGDLVFMDAFKLAHAVTGGFKPEDREFSGIWGQRDPLTNDRVLENKWTHQKNN